jgi:hypothetical protein
MHNLAQWNPLMTIDKNNLQRGAWRIVLALLLMAGMLSGGGAGRAAPASILVVNTAADVFDIAGKDCSTVLVADLPGLGGALSLREAICASNNTPDGAPHSIYFSIGSGMSTIAPATSLPVITRPVTIDGASQPGYAGSPLIVLDGANVVSDGLWVSAGSTTIQGLAIQRFVDSGIYLDTRGFNTIQGNYIGVDPSGNLARGNGRGIYIAYSSRDNLIGGGSAEAGNLISGNLGNGIYTAAKGTIIVGNKIGTNLSGTAAVPNQTSGVYVKNSRWNLIGGWNSGEGNLISGNLEAGLVIDSGMYNYAVGNTIGLNVTGTAVLGNGQNGVILKKTDWPYLENNLVSGNDGYGVFGRDVFYGYLDGNKIGVNAAGNAALPNTYGGMALINAYNNLVGSAQGNLISGNGGTGLLLSGGMDNYVFNNKIGVDAGGSLALGNASDGIVLWDSPYNRIGGETADEGNRIAANGGAGVHIHGEDSYANYLFGNQIGLGANGAALGNALDGVLIVDADDTLVGVGGSGSYTYGLANTIAYNRRAGVAIAGQAVSNHVDRNALFANRGLGIDLGANGEVEANDWLDADLGPNQFQNYPVLTLPANPSPSFSLAGMLHSEANTTYTLDFYATVTCDRLGHGEGQQWLGAILADTDANGVAVFNFDLGAPLPADKPFVTATATGPDGNTSEFSACVPEVGLVYLPFVRR